MNLNNKTYQALEFDSLLLLLTEFADTPLGKKATAASSPLPDKASAIRECSRVELLLSFLEEEGSISLYWFKHLDESFFDLKEKYNLIEGESLYVIAKVLQEAGANQQMLEAAGEENQDYLPLAELLETPGWIAEDILNAIESDGSILDSASPALAELRQEYRKRRQRINALLRNYFDQGEFPNYTQDDFITIRNDRAVIPVRVEKKNTFQGIIHDRSRSGDTVFFEPMDVVEHNNALANLKAEIRLEEARVLQRLSNAVFNNWDPVTSTVKNTAYMDSLAARARFAAATESVVPDISDTDEFYIRGARHPLIDERLRKARSTAGLDDEYSSARVVPVDIRFNEDHQVLVVTGPNAGGKTVTLKTAGMLAMMAQSGMLVPAEEYRAPFFNLISADIGDSQDLLSHLSSFSSHLYWLRHVLQDLKAPSLILIDEIAAATDPGEGAALAMAILEHLRDEHAFVMTSTHLESLKAFAHSQQAMQNCSLEFDPETLKPTYRLRYGLPGKSNALETAREMKLPRALMERAHYYMGDQGASISDIVTKMQEQLTSLQKAEDAAKAEQRKMEKARQHYVSRLDKAEERANAEVERIQKEWKEYRTRHDKALQEALALAREAENAEQYRQKMKEAINERDEEYKQLELQKKRTKKAPAENSPLEKNQEVLLEGSNQRGTVEKDWKPGKDGVAVNFNGKRMTLPRSSLRLAPRKSEKEKSGVTISVKTEQRKPQTELVLVGSRVEEALSELDRFIDDALVNRFETLRIVHGRGTGRLRAAIENHLKNHPMAASWRAASPAEGGSAVTILTLTV